MAKLDLGKLKTGKGVEYRVYWDDVSREIYIEFIGTIGKANTGREALIIAEHYLSKR